LYSKSSINEKLIKLIENNGYIYRNQKTDIVVRDIILNVLNRIGKSFSKALIYQICNLYGLSQNELLSNYELFENSLTRVLGKTGYPIILRIKKELLKYLIVNKFEISIKDILDPSFNVPQIIYKLSESYNYDLIAENLNNNKQNHMILLSNNDDKHIEKIISNLVRISKNIRDIKRVVIVLHDQFDEQRYFRSVSDINVYYLNDMVSSSSSSSSSSTDKFFKLDNDYNNNNNNNDIDLINFEQFDDNSNIQVFCFIDIEILNQFNNYKILKLLEEKFQKLYNLNKIIQICCIYDMSNFYTKEYEIKLLRDFINHHDMVIVDEPLVMYQKFDIKNDIVK
jgi:hypothetical protein